MTNCFAVLVVGAAILSTSAAPSNKPSFNLFLNKEQSRHYLGVEIDLFYVQAGVPNQYALGFSVRVPIGTSNTVFNWQNLRAQTPLYYRFETAVDDLEAMHLPKFNVPIRGVLPTLIEEFSVSLPCTGVKAADVRVTITLTVSTTDSFDDARSTVIKIPRKKTCFENEQNNGSPTTVSVTTESLEEEELQEEEEFEDTSAAQSSFQADRVRKASNHNRPRIDKYQVERGPLVLALGAIAFFVATAFMTMSALCYLKGRRIQRPQTDIIVEARPAKYFQDWAAAGSTLKSHDGAYGMINAANLVPLQGQHVARVGSPVASTVASYSSYRKGAPPMAPTPSPIPFIHYYNTMNSSQGHHSSLGQYSIINDTSCSSLLSEQIAELAVDPRCFTFVKLLSEGGFGRVFHALLNEGSNPQSQSILVKTVAERASVDQTQLFLQEGMMLFGMEHPNVLPVVRSCVDTPTGLPVLMYPFMSEGNLKQFLRRGGFSQGERGHHSLRSRDLIEMGLQILDGMKYLHKKFFLHKDIATRNCMVDEHLNVKITDNALSRDIFPEDYHCIGDNENRPLKWMAIESMQDNDYTFASDVWMFGVTLWELVTLGQQPYAEVDPFEMEQHLKDGYRLAQPLNCPDELFRIMGRCWSMSPSDRLTLPQVIRLLTAFYNQLDEYI